MTLEQLHRMHSTQPFQSFRIHIADGRAIDVTHPECLAHAPNARTFIVVKPDESFEVIDLLLVTSLEVTNGKSHRSRNKK